MKTKINPVLQMLITSLKRKASEEKTPLWSRVADDLSRSTRQRRVVNLSRINRFTTEGELVIVPGKVLAAGELAHKVTVSAFKFSKQAVEKIESSGGKILPIESLMNDSIKGKKVRVLG